MNTVAAVSPQHSFFEHLTMPTKTSRMLFFDDNIRQTGGHFLELATLLIRGARQLGYVPSLITNRDFRETSLHEYRCPVIPAFRPRRMIRWSLGVDGASQSMRDPLGSPIGSPWQRTKQRFRDRMVRSDKHPTYMLWHYATDFAGVLDQLAVNSSDVIVINTCDDFSLLALAQALEGREYQEALNIHALFHFAVKGASHSSHINRSKMFGDQVNETLKTLTQSHHVHLHATTDPLANQLQQCGIETPVSTIPYPTRRREIKDDVTLRGRAKVVLAGLPRAEKGRGAMVGLLSQLAPALHDESSKLCMSMQMPVKKWQRMVPPSLHGDYELALATPLNLRPDTKSTQPLEILTSGLDAETYHGWLDTADIGLFLYEPDRYIARCSGVLLEMLARGIPVLVPDGCWLADYVRKMSGSQLCGAIYQDRSSIPQQLHNITRDYATYRRSAIAVANKVADEHDGVSTLVAMGIPSRVLQVLAG